MAAVTIYSDFGAPQNKSITVSVVSPSICHDGMAPDATVLVYLMFSSIHIKVALSFCYGSFRNL